MIDISKISGNQIDRASIVHSSGIGKAVYGDAYSGTSNETYAMRQHTEANRKQIGNYRSANVHTDHRLHPKPISIDGRPDIALRRDSSAPRLTPVVLPKQRPFREPPKRHFDPYSS